jgi:hypothetical protein
MHVTYLYYDTFNLIHKHLSRFMKDFGMEGAYYWRNINQERKKERKKEIPYKRACGGHRVHIGYTFLYEQGYEGVVSRDACRHHPGAAMST